MRLWAEALCLVGDNCAVLMLACWEIGGQLCRNGKESHGVWVLTKTSHKGALT